MRTVWQPVSIVVSLLLLLTYLLLQSRSPDLALQTRMHEAIQTLQLHDTELTRDVLLARAGLLPIMMGCRGPGSVCPGLWAYCALRAPRSRARQHRPWDSTSRPWQPRCTRS